MGEDDEWMRTDNCYARNDDWRWMLAHSLAVAGALATAKRDGILFGFEQGVEHQSKLMGGQAIP